MPDDHEVRARSPEASGRFLDAELARRRKRRPHAREIEPKQLAGHLEPSGERRRLAGLRVLSPGDWRWPWRRLAHVDIDDCDFESVKLRGLLRPLEFDDCRFENVDLGGSRIRAAFSDCSFTKVSLAGAGTSVVEGGAYRRASFTELDARGVLFDGVRFDDCSLDGLRGGGGTVFERCAFARTTFRGTMSEISFNDCVFEDVDMADAHVWRLYLRSRRARGLVYPAARTGFVIETSAYRDVVEAMRSSLDEADLIALRNSFVDGGYQPADELVIDGETLEKLDEAAQDRLTAALFERRLVRRG